MQIITLDLFIEVISAQWIQKMCVKRIVEVGVLVNRPLQYYAYTTDPDCWV